jgi:hypothetical protein
VERGLVRERRIVRLLTCRLGMGDKGEPGGAQIKDKDVNVQTVGQQKSRRVGARLGYDIGVESCVMSYIGEHDIAPPYKVRPRSQRTHKVAFNQRR